MKESGRPLVRDSFCGQLRALRVGKWLVVEGRSRKSAAALIFGLHKRSKLRFTLHQEGEQLKVYRIK